MGNMMRTFFAGAGVALLVAGCTTGPGDVPLAANHPANPNAPEAPAGVPSNTLAIDYSGAPVVPAEAVADEPRAAHAHAHAHDTPTTRPGENAAPSATQDTSAPAAAYTCPMHKEVVSDRPGRCPQCGMKLVPKASLPAGRPRAESGEHAGHGGRQ